MYLLPMMTLRTGAYLFPIVSSVAMRRHVFCQCSSYRGGLRSYGR
jgi:hypothetical protein